jgi:K+-transporting ATPase c subunit
MTSATGCDGSISRMAAVADPRRIAIRQRAQQDRVDQREDRDRRTGSQRECHDGRE